ncbi:MAG: AbrB family looped-hinge helix DNA binding protein [Verrucomicrobiales bacterium]|jgi:AbrB family looped-hinge helix DNA binding protein
MKIGERGQVTIPKDLREKFSLLPETEVEFTVAQGQLIIRKKLPVAEKTRKARIQSCVGILGGEPDDVDTFIEEMRGR